MRTALIASIASILTHVPAPAQETAPKPAPKSWTSTDAYPLDTCVVSGRPFAGEKTQVVDIDGRKFKLCSAECGEKLRKDPTTYATKLDRATIDAQLRDYPLDRCPISGKQLGSMGDPVQIVLDNHLVQLCCGGCKKKAQAKKAEIVANIETAAYAKQKDGYPLKTCLKTGEELDPKTMVEVMHGPTLLRFGAQDCVSALDEAPATMLARLNAARKVKEAPGNAQKPAPGLPQGKGKQEPGSGHEGHGKQDRGAEHEGHGGGGQTGGDTTGHSNHGGGCGGNRGGECGR